MEAQNFAAILKIEAERKAGQLLRLNGFGEHGGDRKSRHTMSLEDIGISRINSQRWVRMTEVTEDQLTELIDQCNQNLKELTSAAVLRIAQTGRAIPPSRNSLSSKRLRRCQLAPGVNVNFYSSTDSPRR